MTSALDLENTALKRWVLELSQWDQFVRHRVHRRGEQNLVCDLLSRYAVSTGYTAGGERPAEFSPLLRSVVRRTVTRGAIKREARADSTMRTGVAEGVEETRGATETLAGSTMLTGVAEGGEETVSEGCRGRPQRRAAIAANKALGVGEGAGEATRVVEVFNNPHTHALSPFLRNVLDAQRRLTPKAVKEYLRNPHWAAREVEWNGERVLMARGKVLVPETELDLVAEIFAKLHDGQLHAGPEVVREALTRAHLFIPNFTRAFGEYYAACTCQHARAPTQLRLHGPLMVGPRYWPLAHIFMDFASLPVTEMGGKTYVGVALTVDACSRVCQFTLVEDQTAATAIRALERWTQTWGIPCMVHSDGGPHFKAQEFKDYLAQHGIVQDMATPEHPRGRGMVERLVGKLKSGLVRLLPQGRLYDWPKVMGDLERRVNRMPHKGLAGVSPFDYLIKGHRQRADVLANLGGLELNTPQSEEDLELVLDTMRQVADWCGEISAVKRAMASEKEYAVFPAREGDLVLRYTSTRENSLEPYYQGPYRVTVSYGNGFYQIAELLAGDNLGVSVECHASRLIMFDGSRTSGDAEHARKLGAQDLIVEEVVEGPRASDMRFLVRWRGVAEPTWEPSSAGLRMVVKFKEYCASKGLDLKGEPIRKEGKRRGRKPKAAEGPETAGTG